MASENDQTKSPRTKNRAAQLAKKAKQPSSSVLHPPPVTMTLPVSFSELSIGNDKLWSVSQLPGDLHSIDLMTGLQSIEASSQTGGGVPPGPMLAGRYDSASDRFIAIADLRVIAIDPKTESRQHLGELQQPAPLPAPPSFFLPSGMALSQDGMRAWISDLFSQTVIEVNLANGSVANRLLLNVAPLSFNSTIVPAIYALNLATSDLTMLADLTAVEPPFGETTTAGFLTPKRTRTVHFGEKKQFSF